VIEPHERRPQVHGHLAAAERCRDPPARRVRCSRRGTRGGRAPRRPAPSGSGPSAYRDDRPCGLARSRGKRRCKHGIDWRIANGGARSAARPWRPDGIAGRPGTQHLGQLVSRRFGRIDRPPPAGVVVFVVTAGAADRCIPGRTRTRRAVVRHSRGVRRTWLALSGIDSADSADSAETGPLWAGSR